MELGSNISGHAINKINGHVYTSSSPENKATCRVILCYALLYYTTGTGTSMIDWVMARPFSADIILVD